MLTGGGIWLSGHPNMIQICTGTVCIVTAPEDLKVKFISDISLLRLMSFFHMFYI